MFLPVIGKPGDGSAPHCGIADEFHEHQTSEFVDTMITGMVGREQPLMLYITTAGDNIASACYEKRDEVCRVLQGITTDDRLFGIIYTIDEDDSWLDPKVLDKANPNIDVSVDRETLEAGQRSAKDSPIEQSRFKTRHLNVWVGQHNGLINLTKWQALGDVGLTPDELMGEPCWFSGDLALSSDLCATIKMFRREINGAPHYYGFLKCYLPEEEYESCLVNRAIYAGAIRDGSLIITPGATVDYETIVEDVLADAAKYNPAEMIYDPFNATHFSQLLSAAGMTTVECTQKVNDLAVPTDQLLSIIKDSRFHHNGDRFYAWQAGNVVGRTGRKGLVMPAKGPQAYKKIDGIVATIMAIKRASDEQPVGTSGELVVA